jgi:hypothetical protein
VTLWVGAGRWGLSLKRFFSYLFKAFFGAGPKGSVLIDDLSTGLYASGRTPASTKTICAGTRSLASAPPASKDPFYPPTQIVCGLMRLLRTWCKYLYFGTDGVLNKPLQNLAPVQPLLEHIVARYSLL